MTVTKRDGTALPVGLVFPSIRPDVVVSHLITTAKEAGLGVEKSTLFLGLLSRHTYTFGPAT